MPLRREANSVIADGLQSHSEDHGLVLSLWMYLYLLSG